MTQEALLGLIETYATTRVRMPGVIATQDASTYSEATRERQAAYRALLDAVRSLPIEAGR